MQQKLQFPRAYVLLLYTASLLSNKLLEGVIERDGLTSFLRTRWGLKVSLCSLSILASLLLFLSFSIFLLSLSNSLLISN